MFVLMRCLHHPGQDGPRDAHRPAHRAWVQSGGDGAATVLIGSALYRFMRRSAQELSEFHIDLPTVLAPSDEPVLSRIAEATTTRSSRRRDEERREGEHRDGR